MDRKHFYQAFSGSEESDYEKYLNTQKLFSLQKSFEDLCNPDELQFIIVHQVEELWMKLISFTLLEVNDYLSEKNTNKVISLFNRIHKLQNMMIEQLSLLKTMSCKEFQEIRLGLGNGDGRESPGFKLFCKMPNYIWKTYVKHYLELENRTINKVYDTEYQHDDAYVIAELLIELDELFNKFLYHHIQLVERTIGISAKSLKGRPVNPLRKRLDKKLFPELWKVRCWMTDQWIKKHGEVRPSLGSKLLKKNL